MHRLLRIAFFFFLLSRALPALSTHIVGGEMTYSCLGNNNYEITLVVFRDCYNGAPGAFFDNPAYIGIYNQGRYLANMDLAITFNPKINDTLDPVLANPCLVVPPNVCVHTTIYKDTVNLPPIPGGYTLVYQRCCRNVTIQNIVSPLQTGATFSVTITEEALNNCNSSPQFNFWPPLYICANEPIDFDQSARDRDGDSIVYKLCTPLQGATVADPYPTPNRQTVPREITWVDPPYGVANMLNGFPGGEPLRINPATGFLTGLPNTIGQFVVGICIEEYRGGKIIGTTRRDFQYNVGACGTPTSAFFAPKVYCDGLNVKFQNQSIEATNFEWTFYNTGKPDSISKLASPVFSFPDTGLYRVRLIAEPNTSCADTAEQLIRLLPNSLKADFNVDLKECSDSLILQAFDVSLDTLSNPAKWSWELSQNQKILAVASVQEPAFRVKVSNGTVRLVLIVEAINGCLDTLEKTFTIRRITDEPDLKDAVICQGTSVPLNPQFTTTYKYTWSPATGLSNANAGNPIANPTVSTVYTVNIKDPLTGCQIDRQVVVTVPPALKIQLPPDTLICNNTFNISVQSNQPLKTNFWYRDLALLGSGTSLLLPLKRGPQVIVADATDLFGCPGKDTVVLSSWPAAVQVPGDQTVCPGDALNITASNGMPGDVLSYSWTPGNIIQSGQGDSIVTINTSQPGIYPLQLLSANQYGCTAADSLQVVVLDTTAAAGNVNPLQCAGLTVTLEVPGPNGTIAVWNPGDPSKPGLRLQGGLIRYTYPDTGKYTVTLEFPGFDRCLDPITLPIHVKQSKIVPAFDWEQFACGDTATLRFTDKSVNLQSNILTHEWFFSDGTKVNGKDIFIKTATTPLDVILVLNSDDGCTDTLRRQINFELIQLDLADTLVLCKGSSVRLDTKGLPTDSYRWFPDADLDDPTSAAPITVTQVSRTYTVEVTRVANTDTCRARKTVYVQVNGEPDWTAPRDTSTCDAQFTLQTGAGPGVQILWSSTAFFNDTLGKNATLILQPQQPSIVFVKAITPEGCEQIRSVAVFGKGITGDLPNILLCEGDTAQFTWNNLVNAENATVYWTPERFLLDEPDILTPRVVANGTFTNQVFTVTLVNQDNCALVKQVNVQVAKKAPTPLASVDRDTIAEGQSVNLTVSNAGTWPVQWEPSGIIDNPNNASTSATPPVTTTFTVTLKGENGCNDSAQLRVVVLEVICREPWVFVPNAFSPDGDGFNDTWGLYSFFAEALTLSVYDRWGEKVWETNEVKNYWDGTYRGKELPSDVYGYYLRVKCYGGQEYFKKGNVTLLR